MFVDRYFCDVNTNERCVLKHFFENKCLPTRGNIFILIVRLKTEISFPQHISRAVILIGNLYDCEIKN